MSDDQIFRLVLIAGFVFVFPFAFYFRIRSQGSGEKLDRSQEGLFIMVALRLLGITTMLGILAYAIQPEWMRWSQLPLPAWLRWCGAPIGLAAGSLIIWTFSTLGPNLTDTVVTRKEHTLVTGGPYRWVRHPFYVAFCLAVAANSLLTANWLLALTGSLAFALVVLRTGIEEQKLVERFGSEYTGYMERTNRFVPRFGGDRRAAG